MCLLYKKPKLSDITNLNHNWKYGQWQIKRGIHTVPFTNGRISLYFIWTSVCLLAVTNHINSLLLTIMSCKALSVSKRCPDKSSSTSRWCLINKCPSVAAHQKLVWANRILHHVQSARRQCVNTSLLSRGKLLHVLPFHNLIHTPKTRATLLPKLLLRGCVFEGIEGSWRQSATQPSVGATIYKEAAVKLEPVNPTKEQRPSVQSP